MANTAAFGIYANREQVAAALYELEQDGFRSADLAVLSAAGVGTKDLSVRKHSKMLDGAAWGGFLGGIVGGAAGWVLGMGYWQTPALQAVILAGPVLVLLSGVGVGGVIGALVGAIFGSAIPRYEAKRYTGRTKSAGLLLSIHCDDPSWTTRAKARLRRTGAEDIGVVAESRGDYGNSEHPAARTAA